MNAEQFLHFVKSPHRLRESQVDEMQKLAQHFPYSQTIQLMFAYSLSLHQDIRFNEQLYKAALYAGSRKYLKRTLEKLQQEEVEETLSVVSEIVVAKPEVLVKPEPEEQTPVVPSGIQEIVSEIPKPESSRLEYHEASFAEPDEDLIEKRNKVRSKAELLQLVKQRLAAIEAEKEEQRRQLPVSPLEGKLALIDQFIKDEPSISRPEKTDFFDPDAAAQESVFDDGLFVTETLARIYADQGNYRKAKEIYQILSLNNPEKSSYFAALIQDLDKKIN